MSCLVIPRVFNCHFTFLENAGHTYSQLLEFTNSYLVIFSSQHLRQQCAK